MLSTPNVMTRNPIATRRAMRGSALLFLMILLLGVAMLALLANRSALLESVASRSNRDYLIARNAAESAIADFVNALGGDRGKVFRLGADEQLRTQAGGCVYGDTVVKGTPNASGTQASGGSATPGLVDFRACTQPWWQQITLATFESVSAEIGEATGDTSSTYLSTATVSADAPRSYKRPRIIIEPLQYSAPGQDASALGAGAAGNGGASQSTVFRVTAVGYGPTADSVVMLQETWRPQD